MILRLLIVEDEKQICDYIELPNENQYKESDLAEKIKRIYVL